MCLPGCRVSEVSKPHGSEEGFQSPFLKLEGKEKDIYLAKITALAASLDRKFEDGWIAGKNSRVLKTLYRGVDPSIKAEFALAYQAMIVDSNQNLSQSLESYIPYSKRAEFAYQWWSNSVVKDKFLAEPLKKRVYWVHESMLDASELFWRVFEKEYASRVNSAMVLAHYKEQEMVFDFMEKDGSPSSFSEQYHHWKKKGDSPL